MVMIRIVALLLLLSACFSLCCAAEVAASPGPGDGTVPAQDGGIAVDPTAPTPITGCTVIDTPGNYVLANDITDNSCAAVIEIQCSGVVLDGGGHLIDRVSAGYANPAGIRVNGTPDAPLSGVVIRDLRVTHGWVGIQGEHCEHLTLSNVSTERQIGSYGIILAGCDNSTVRSCRVAENGYEGYGIYVQGSDGVTLTDCLVENCDPGVSLSGVRNAAMTGCTVRDGLWIGIVAGSPDNATTLRFGGNLIERNGYGGLLLWSGVADVTNNTIRDNGDAGIRFGPDVGDGGTIAGNVIAGNEYGIMDSGVPFNGRWVAYNNLFNNTVNVQASSQIDWSVPERPGPNIVGGPSVGGNCWVLPDGTGFSETHPDADGDGFCDEAYAITWYYSDPLPLRRPTPGLRPLPGMGLLPLDPDGDGRHEDLNGNGRRDFSDVVLYFNQVSWIAENEPVPAFDYNGNGRVDFADVVWLFDSL